MEMNMAKLVLVYVVWKVKNLNYLNTVLNKIAILQPNYIPWKGVLIS